MDPSENLRPCPVCSSTEFTEFAEERMDMKKINDFSYSSRKQPEFMCLRLVKCSECHLLYAPSPPTENFLSQAYADASFDSGTEAECAAKSYISAMAPNLAKLYKRGAAVDVGAGSGPLLPWLRKAGFDTVIGVEPSRAAIDAASDFTKPFLREGMFSRELLSDVNPSLICSFMTLEHISEPSKFTKTAFDILEKDGMIAVVVHNWEGLLNRMLGLKSPIIDIEHLQLFNVKSVQRLLADAGFKDVEVRSFCNVYPLKYWLRLMPLPISWKKLIEKIVFKIGFSELLVPLKVGNIIAVGFKKEEGKI